MNFRIFHGGKPTFNKKDFDNKDYTGFAVFYTKKEKPVALMQHKTSNVWKVQYGFSTLYSIAIQRLWIIANPISMTKRARR